MRRHHVQAGTSYRKAQKHDPVTRARLVDYYRDIYLLYPNLAVYNWNYPKNRLGLPYGRPAGNLVDNLNNHINKYLAREQQKVVYSLIYLSAHPRAFFYFLTLISNLYWLIASF